MVGKRSAMPMWPRVSTSMAWWSWVVAKGYVPEAFTILAPSRIHGEAMSRRDSKRNPAPPQMRPLNARPPPSDSCTVWSAMPGARRTAASTDWPPAEIVTRSPSPTPSSRADFGLINTALSQVNLVMGSGSSCNQPLLAKRPSQRVGDAVNRKVHPSPAPESGATEPPAIDGETALVAEPSTTPSCRAVRQAAVLPEKFAST